MPSIAIEHGIHARAVPFAGNKGLFPGAHRLKTVWPKLVKVL
jgi:hypothetical protein